MRAAANSWTWVCLVTSRVLHCVFHMVGTNTHIKIHMMVMTTSSSIRLIHNLFGNRWCSFIFDILMSWCKFFFGYFWMKWERVFTFLFGSLYDSDTIFSINCDGTRCKSIVLTSRFLSSVTDRYLHVTANIFSGFLVFADLMKFLIVSGVWTISSWVTWLGYGWKYHKSWYIMSFFMFSSFVTLIGNRPSHLRVLLNRMTFGINVLISFLSLIASIRLNIARHRPKYLRYFHIFHHGMFVPYILASYHLLVRISATSYR